MFGSLTRKVKVSTATHAIENVTSANPGEQKEIQFPTACPEEQKEVAGANRID